MDLFMTNYNDKIRIKNLTKHFVVEIIWQYMVGIKNKNIHHRQIKSFYSVP